MLTEVDQIYIHGHSLPGSTNMYAQVDGGSEGIAKTIDELETAIRKNYDLSKYSQINVLGCYTDDIAKELSKRLGKKVTGYTGKIRWNDINGSIIKEGSTVKVTYHLNK